jgi:small subunit ribosomal protein S6
MERNMRINEDVLRYLTVKVDELDPNQSPILQRDRERERDRDREGRTGWDERSAAEAAGSRRGRRFDDDRPPRRFDDDRPPRRRDEDREPAPVADSGDKQNGGE